MQTVRKTRLLTAALTAAAFLAPCFAVVETDAPGYLGVRIESMDRKDKQESGTPFGVRIAAVEKDSPAQKAGMLEKDIIQTYGGEKIRKPADLIRRVRATSPDSTVSVGLVRGKAKVLAAVKIVKVPKIEREHKVIMREIGMRPRLGVRIHGLNDDLSGYFGVPADEGVLILEVDGDGPAMKAGLKAGDVIVRIGKEKVYETEDVTDILKGFKTGDKAEVAVMRKGRESLFQVALEEFSPKNFPFGWESRDPVDIRIFKHGNGELMRIGEEPAVREEILRENLDEARESLEGQRKIIEIRTKEMEESSDSRPDGIEIESSAIPTVVEESAKI
jgi:predicted metalloprotease with PDZ domain